MGKQIRAFIKSRNIQAALLGVFGLALFSGGIHITKKVELPEPAFNVTIVALNQKDDSQFKTSIRVEIVSPFSLGTLKMGVKNVPSVQYIDVSSLSSTSVNYGKDLSKENGYAYVIVSNASGMYQIDILTMEAEPITTANVEILKVI